MARFWIIAGIAVAVAACSEKPELTEEQKRLRSEIVLVDPTSVRGVRYVVSAMPNQPGQFQVMTADRRPGTREGVTAALRREFGCTSIEIVSHNRNWSAAEAKGAFCKSGTQLYRY